LDQGISFGMAGSLENGAARFWLVHVGNRPTRRIGGIMATDRSEMHLFDRAEILGMYP